MTIKLDHTIVAARDKHESATFIADILGVPVEAPWGPFLPIRLGNDITLEYLEVGDAAVQPQHYAFLVDDPEFDAAFARIREAGVAYWADPFHRRPGEINHDHGGRGVYFADPDGHNMELQTVPYGDPPGAPDTGDE
jgi:catechol 2,3-dioxygenase-like lactoylglutathione lyase family enzyme